MNFPKPIAPKTKLAPKSSADIVKKLKGDSTETSKPKMIVYVCHLIGGDVVEVRAEKLEDVGDLCFKKYGHFPFEVKKKPFEPKEHLTQRLSNHEGLRALQKSMNASTPKVRK